MLDWSDMGFPTPPPPGGGTPPPAAGGFPSPPTGPPPGPTGPYIPPPGDDGGGGSGRGKWFLALAALVVAALVAGVVILTGDEASADEVFLEPVDFSGDNPFVDDTGTEGGADLGALVRDQRADGAEVVSGSVNGDDVGLYGGTLNEAVCDRGQLIEFLDAEDAKARAFAGVLGIDVEDVPDYVASLTPMILRGDTRVTNHGFEDGEATAFQAVLEAGTAVLVDEDGIPRVKCNCGNPLAPPVEADSPTYTGDRWDGFDPADVQVTFVDNSVDVFVLTDIVNGGTFTRPAGTDGDEDEPGDGEDPPPPPTTAPPETTAPPATTVPPATTAPLGTGDVQVTLSWFTGEDLDLHVIDPNGDEVSFSNPSVPSGGQLDQDDTAGCESPGSHVENVFWPSGGAPAGQYEVFVVSFRGCGTGGNFTLDIRVGGELVDSISASVADGGTTESIPFSVG